MTYFKTVIFSSCIFLASCDVQQSVEDYSLQVFKNTYQDGLIDLCGKDESCQSLIDKHFEQCLDIDLARQLVSAEQEKASELSIQLVEKTMSCIEKFQVKQ